LLYRKLYFISILFFVIINFFILNNSSEFRVKWWFWLIFTGVTMACCVCVKFVGLFQVTFIGLMTIVDLWFILGKLSKPIVIFKNILNVLLIHKIIIIFF